MNHELIDFNNKDLIDRYNSDHVSFTDKELTLDEIHHRVTHGILPLKLLSDKLWADVLSKQIHCMDTVVKDQ